MCPDDTHITSPQYTSAQQTDARDEYEGNYSKSGVDITLIQWFLSLSPKERLQTVQNYIGSIEKIRHANPST